MELIVLLLSSISGALIGTSVGIYLLYRKLRPITGAELDLTRSKLRSTEFALSSATANLENLKRLVEEREIQATAAAHKATELEAETAILRQKFAEDNGSQEEIRRVAETASLQIAKFEAQVDADERQIKELSGQVSRLTTELDQVQNHLKEETAARMELESELSAEHDKSARLGSRIAELESERSHFDLTLQEERQSAAKGIELLLMAQENFARVFRTAQPAVRTETNGQQAVDHAMVAAGE